jgi:hypothetical protein
MSSAPATIQGASPVTVTIAAGRKVMMVPNAPKLGFASFEINSLQKLLTLLQIYFINQLKDRALPAPPPVLSCYFAFTNTAGERVELECASTSSSIQDAAFATGTRSSILVNCTCGYCKGGSHGPELVICVPREVISSACLRETELHRTRVASNQETEVERATMTEPTEEDVDASLLVPSSVYRFFQLRLYALEEYIRCGHHARENTAQSTEHQSRLAQEYAWSTDSAEDATDIPSNLMQTFHSTTADTSEEDEAQSIVSATDTDMDYELPTSDGLEDDDDLDWGYQSDSTIRTTNKSIKNRRV